MSYSPETVRRRLTSTYYEGKAHEWKIPTSWFPLDEWLYDFTANPRTIRAQSDIITAFGKMVGPGINMAPDEVIAWLRLMPRLTTSLQLLCWPALHDIKWAEDLAGSGEREAVDYPWNHTSTAEIEPSRYWISVFTALWPPKQQVLGAMTGSYLSFDVLLRTLHDDLGVAVYQVGLKKHWTLETP